MSRILVTGHRGLLGSACVRRFEKEHEVLTVNSDLRNPMFIDMWMQDNQPDAVIHCAAKVGGVKANRDEPVAFMQDNLSINSSVINAAAKAGVKRLINIGTSCMYPKDAEPPVAEEALFTGPLEPSVESYAIAKIAAYGLCRAYNAERGLKYVTVCPCNLYGPNDNYGPSAHVIPALIHKVYTSQHDNTGTIKVWGNGKAIREFLHADDAASAIDIVLKQDSPHDLINIGSGSSTSIEQLVWLVCDAFGAAPAILWDSSGPTGISYKTFDIRRISDIGWWPSIALREGLESTVADYLHNPNQRRK